MPKLGWLKAIGKVALAGAGVAGVGGSDRIRALEAEKKLVEVHLKVALEALREAYVQAERGDLAAVKDTLRDAGDVLGTGD